MSPRDHPLFQAYPIIGTAAISSGTVPTPYHIYDGEGLFIGGVGDAEAVRRLLKDEAVQPIQTTSGQVVMGLWICNFTEASLGPHHELQVSFFVPDPSAPEPQPIAPHPLAALSLMLTRPDVNMLCYGLWNNTATVVSYNRELLSLNARQTDSHIERTAQTFRFRFKDPMTDGLILSGQIRHPRRTAWSATWALLSQVGFRRMLALAQQPWVSMRVLNPLGVTLNRHAIAEAFNKNDVNVPRYFDRRADTLEFGDDVYRALRFAPQCVQYMQGFKFVYLQPK